MKALHHHLLRDLKMCTSVKIHTPNQENANGKSCLFCMDFNFYLLTQMPAT